MVCSSSFTWPIFEYFVSYVWLGSQCASAPVVTWIGDSDILYALVLKILFFVKHEFVKEKKDSVENKSCCVMSACGRLQYWIHIFYQVIF